MKRAQRRFESAEMMVVMMVMVMMVVVMMTMMVVMMMTMVVVVMMMWRREADPVLLSVPQPNWDATGRTFSLLKKILRNLTSSNIFSINFKEPVPQLG